MTNHFLKEKYKEISETTNAAMLIMMLVRLLMRSSRLSASAFSIFVSSILALSRCLPTFDFRMSNNESAEANTTRSLSLRYSRMLSHLSPEMRLSMGVCTLGLSCNSSSTVINVL